VKRRTSEAPVPDLHLFDGAVRKRLLIDRVQEQLKTLLLAVILLFLGVFLGRHGGGVVGSGKDTQRVATSNWLTMHRGTAAAV